MEIIHEIFIYNRLFRKLDEPISVRLTIHNGPCEYSENEEDIKKGETVRKIIEIESRYTKPNSITVSNTVM